MTAPSTSDACLKADGNWSPMSHCNRNDDSFHDLRPLFRIETTQTIRDPRVSPAAHRGLGAYTGTSMAVCSYGEPSYPGLVAFDYGTGDVLWTSQMEDLPGARHRRIAGVLLARLSDGRGGDRGVVFAANQLEVLAYNHSGIVLWRTRTPDMSRPQTDGVGAVTSLSFRDDGYLILTTSRGWIVLLSARNGEVVDARRLDVEVVVSGRRHRGTFVNFKSSVVIGDTLYLMTKFRPAHPGLGSGMEHSVFLVRQTISPPPGRQAGRTERPIGPQRPHLKALDWVQVGVTRLRGGSPCAWRSPTGNIVFVNSDQLVDGRLVPSVTALFDDGECLRILSKTLLPAPSGDAIRGAPAFHAATQTLIAPALGTVFILRGAGGLDGAMPRVDEVSADRMMANLPAGARATITSPGALTYDRESDQIVMCNGFKVFLAGTTDPYSFLASYVVNASTAGPPRPLWHHPLAATATGVPLPGPGTFGQPAMFGQKGSDGVERTGVVINTVQTGTHFIRG